MATLITITLPTDQAIRVRDVLAAKWGWSVNTGLTKAEFVRKRIVRLIKEAVLDYEAEMASQTAIQSAYGNDVTDVVEDGDG